MRTLLFSCFLLITTVSAVTWSVTESNRVAARFYLQLQEAFGPQYRVSMEAPEFQLFGDRWAAESLEVIDVTTGHLLALVTSPLGSSGTMTFKDWLVHVEDVAHLTGQSGKVHLRPGGSLAFQMFSANGQVTAPANLAIEDAVLELAFNPVGIPEGRQAHLIHLAIHEAGKEVLRTELQSSAYDAAQWPLPAIKEQPLERALVRTYGAGMADRLAWGWAARGTVDADTMAFFPSTVQGMLAPLDLAAGSRDAISQYYTLGGRLDLGISFAPGTTLALLFNNDHTHQGVPVVALNAVWDKQ